MRYPASEKLEIIRLVEQSHLPANKTLALLGIPKTTFYRWYDRYQAFGEAGLEDRRPHPGRVWNRIPDNIREQVAELALDEPELSPRELAVRFTDVEKHYVSEASAYRILKERDLITSPAFVVVKAADEFRDCQWRCKIPRDGGGCCSDRRTGRSNVSDDLGGRDPPARTRRTVPPALLAVALSSLILPPATGIESADHASIKDEFFNAISPVPSAMVSARTASNYWQARLVWRHKCICKFGLFFACDEVSRDVCDHLWRPVRGPVQKSPRYSQRWAQCKGVEPLGRPDTTVRY